MTLEERELRQLALQMAGNLGCSSGTLLVNEAHKILEFLKGGDLPSRPAKKG